MARGNKRDAERRRYVQATNRRKVSSGMTRFYGHPKQDTTPYGAEEDRQANARGDRAGYAYERSKKRTVRKSRRR